MHEIAEVVKEVTDIAKIVRKKIHFEPKFCLENVKKKPSEPVKKIFEVILNDKIRCTEHQGDEIRCSQSCLSYYQPLFAEHVTKCYNIRDNHAEYRQIETSGLNPNRFEPKFCLENVRKKPSEPVKKTFEVILNEKIQCTEHE